MTEPIKLPPWVPTEFPILSTEVQAYARLAVEQATAELRAEVERLRADAADFHMAYRMKCDEKTKAQAVEVESLRAALNEIIRYSKGVHDCSLEELVCDFLKEPKRTEPATPEDMAIYKRIADNYHRSIGCPVCGLGADGTATGYVCVRDDCPTRVTCGGMK
jgi:hypothetical protein